MFLFCDDFHVYTKPVKLQFLYFSIIHFNLYIFRQNKIFRIVKQQALKKQNVWIGTELSCFRVGSSGLIHKCRSIQYISSSNLLNQAVLRSSKHNLKETHCSFTITFSVSHQLYITQKKPHKTHVDH
jgi:hypothetical protein